MPQLRVHLLPALVAPADLAQQSCVVVDVLRATTTMIHAIAAGATSVIPCDSVEDARRRAAELPAGSVVLGGERRGLPIEGFPLGNSPGEYTAQAVGGKTVVMTTTNGTRALLHAAQAAEVFVGAFVNLKSLLDVLASRERVSVLCAGTDGAITREDALFAGAIATHLAFDDSWRLNDSAILARDAWQNAMATKPLVDLLRQSQGGRNLLPLRLDADIVAAARVDAFRVVPTFDAVAGQITVAKI